MAPHTPHACGEEEDEEGGDGDPYPIGEVGTLAGFEYCAWLPCVCIAGFG